MERRHSIVKIATWNVERLKHRANIKQILRACHHIQADILVLTETDRQLRPDFAYGFHTPCLTGNHPVAYRPMENRVSIFTHYPLVRQYDTYDKNTALCVELETPLGNLLVYGTIIGIFGNRHPSFQKDLQHQVEDFKRLSQKHSLCVCGDFNCSFSDNYYFTRAGRATLMQSFSENQLALLTAGQPECIDHIALSKTFVSKHPVEIEEWNIGRTLSDHKGIAVTLL